MSRFGWKIPLSYTFCTLLVLAFAFHSWVRSYPLPPRFYTIVSILLNYSPRPSRNPVFPKFEENKEATSKA